MLNLPLYKQPKESSYCMPYTIKALIEYFTGERYTKKAIARMCHCTYDSGTIIDDGIYVMEKYGLSLEPIETKDIKKAIRRKNPVIVCFQDDIEKNSHTSTIIGLKKVNGIDTVFFNDTYYGKNFTLPLNILEILMNQDLPQNWLMEVKKA